MVQRAIIWIIGIVVIIAAVVGIGLIINMDNYIPKEAKENIYTGLNQIGYENEKITNIKGTGAGQWKNGMIYQFDYNDETLYVQMYNDSEIYAITKVRNAYSDNDYIYINEELMQRINALKEEDKNNYIEYSYEELSRNPESFKGKKVKVTGKVVQVTENGLMVNITNNGYFYQDRVYIVYKRKIGEDKILEKDVITIYGIGNGDYDYTTVMLTDENVPSIKAEYIELNQ